MGDERLDSSRAKLLRLIFEQDLTLGLVHARLGKPSLARLEVLWAKHLLL